MRKGDVLTGKVEYVSFPNKAYVRVDSDNPEDNGRMVVVKNSIPGQTVEFMINKKRGDKCEARLLQVLSTSPQETADVHISLLITAPSLNLKKSRLRKYWTMPLMVSTSLMELSEVLLMSTTAIRWSFPLVMRLRMVSLPLGFIRETVHMIL